MAVTMYHVSRVDLGDSVTLEPKIPDSACMKIEGKKPRVCFAPTIRQCLQAIHSGHGCTDADAIEEFLPSAWKARILNPSVYVTRKTLFKPSSKISDFAVTGEHWSLDPITVKRKGYLDLRAFMLQDRVNIRVPLTDCYYSKFTRGEYAFWQAALLSRAFKVIRTAGCKYENIYSE